MGLNSEFERKTDSLAALASTSSGSRPFKRRIEEKSSFRLSELQVWRALRCSWNGLMGTAVSDLSSLSLSRSLSSLWFLWESWEMEERTKARRDRERAERESERALAFAFSSFNSDQLKLTVVPKRAQERIERRRAKERMRDRLLGWRPRRESDLEGRW